MHSVKIYPIFLAATLSLAPLTTRAATSFIEEFSAASINSNLDAPSEFVFGQNSSPMFTAQNTSGIRRYVTTKDTDFNTVDFTFQITFSVNSPTATQTAFIGFGSGLEDPNFFSEPHTSIYLRQFPDDFEAGQLRLTISNSAQTPPNQPAESTLSAPTGPGNGTHRVQIAKVGNIVTLSLDEDYGGGAFEPNFTASRDMAADLPFLDSTNSRLFFGVQGGNTTFDNLTVDVVPEPSSLFFLSGAALYFLLLRNGRSGTAFSSRGEPNQAKHQQG